ncbi:PREDICTED: receptor-like protein kinase HERK 1 [Nicotiana attenuata]|uniref:Receptor-like protein kinase herk 1 n=1 Tax=Nicotiana attenuata TaxID=49451 RepID=A0A314LG88_NICAT|nr:PREDICTED: receptor-like protein kinase HERK 1 [Nicotiana attenuata]OIT40750.1 receptor-like protein kinase herk 1 [Nicotiana attenuata]
MKMKTSMDFAILKLLIMVLFMLFLMCSSLEFDPVDNYLIDCGSLENTTIGDRVFLADNLNSTQRVFVNTSLESIPSTYSSSLYKTARILNETSKFIFSIKKQGRHWIRLYFFPFSNEKFNLSSAKFSVSAHNFTLVKNFQPLNTPLVKEYSLNITSNSLVLTFTPSATSFAFVNALEVISLPDEVIPVDVGIHNLRTQALETVVRVNMGNIAVLPQNDTSWRSWEPDERYLTGKNLVQFVSKTRAVNYTRGGPSRNIAPPLVYGTATRLQSEKDPNTLANVTWSFNVDPGFDYFIRFHFCYIVKGPSGDLIFNVFLNSQFVFKYLDLNNETSNVFGAPYYMDVVTRLGNRHSIGISIGPTDVGNAYPDGLLNGLEIMKISNFKGSFDSSDVEIQSSSPGSKPKTWLILGSTIGGSILCIVLVVLSFLFCRSRIRVPVDHSTEDHHTTVGSTTEEKQSIISNSNMGYWFPFRAVQEATDNFSKNMVIGFGGFGKVYKGVLRDNTTVAVKRGFPQSQQGLSEFKTEVEMLSQFRHRHLVSLIGYCNEKNEMIIIYEYMENGTLKDHLYGSDLPNLNWRQRLEICIGSAKGLHYLHTGSQKAIIHRDVKSSNILLDENLRAKVSDFGLSKIGPEIDQTHVSTAVKGSFGYLDPEYLTRQQLTEKSDVYSFGVVMFEVLCGRPVIDPSRPKEMVNLVEWVRNCLRTGDSETIVDPTIIREIRPESLIKFVKTAEKCLEEYGVDRPTMGDVLWNLEYALKLQGKDENIRQENEISENQLDNSVLSTEFSMGSMADIAVISMSKVFSNMVKAENKDSCDIC